MISSNIKKYAMFLAVAIIYAVFAFSLINAIFEEPEWNEYCSEFRQPKLAPPELPEECETIPFPGEAQQNACAEQKGQLELKYGTDNCPQEYYCETCQEEYNQAREKHSFKVFFLASLFAIVAIILGITTPLMKGEFANIISPGFIVGGLITLFIGTAIYFGDMGRILRPIVMFIELVIVLYLIYWSVKKKK